MRTVTLVILVLMSLAALGASSALIETEASVSGSVWRDDNGNGQQDAGEPGFANHIVRLKNIQSGEVREAATNGAGVFAFSSLTPGQYSVRVPVGPGWPGYGTYPARQIQGDMEIGISVGSDPISGISFGIYPDTKVPRFAGNVRVDSVPLGARPKVRAFIGAKDCTVEPGLSPPGAPASFYSVAVLPSEVLPGCGMPGASVTFIVNGWEHVLT